MYRGNSYARRQGAQRRGYYRGRRGNYFRGNSRGRNFNYTSEDLSGRSESDDVEKSEHNFPNKQHNKWYRGREYISSTYKPHNKDNEYRHPKDDKTHNVEGKQLNDEEDRDDEGDNILTDKISNVANKEISCGNVDVCDKKECVSEGTSVQQLDDGENCGLKSKNTFGKKPVDEKTYEEVHREDIDNIDNSDEEYGEYSDEYCENVDDNHTEEHAQNVQNEIEKTSDKERAGCGDLFGNDRKEITKENIKFEADKISSDANEEICGENIDAVDSECNQRDASEKYPVQQLDGGENWNEKGKNTINEKSVGEQTCNEVHVEDVGNVGNNDKENAVCSKENCDAIDNCTEESGENCDEKSKNTINDKPVERTYKEICIEDVGNSGTNDEENVVCSKESCDNIDNYTEESGENCDKKSKNAIKKKSFEDGGDVENNDEKHAVCSKENCDNHTEESAQNVQNTTEETFDKEHIGCGDLAGNDGKEFMKENVKFEEPKLTADNGAEKN